MDSPRLGLRLVLLFVLLPLLAACDASSLDDPGSAAVRADAPDAYARSVNAQLAAVRALTAPYHRFEAGVAAGWDEDLTGCIPEMGHHYANPDYAFFDDGVVDALQPEVLLYEPQRNGRKRLVGVEYVVLYDHAPADGPPPVLFGEEFHHNDVAGLWMLHAWIWKNNPDGMFTDYNPNVSC